MKNIRCFVSIVLLILLVLPAWAGKKDKDSAVAGEETPPAAINEPVVPPAPEVNAAKEEWKDSVEVAVSMESSDTAIILAKGEAAFALSWQKWLEASVKIRSTDTYGIKLAEALVRVDHAGWFVQAGYDKDETGLDSFVKSLDHPGAGIAGLDVLADGLGYTEYGLGVVLGHKRNKDTGPWSLALAASIEPEALQPYFGLAGAWHFAGKESALGLGVRVVPLLVEHPLDGMRTDLHAVFSVFAHDFGQGFQWGVSGLLGSVPDTTPWTFPAYEALPIQWQLGGSLQFGWGFEIGDMKLSPGVLASGTVADLWTTGAVSGQVLAGASWEPVAGFGIEAWVGASGDQDGFSPAWNASFRVQP